MGIILRQKKDSKMDLISWFFLVVVIIIVGAVLIGNFYVLVYFSHPEDGGVPGIWIYRGIVVRFSVT